MLMMGKACFWLQHLQHFHSTPPCQVQVSLIPGYRKTLTALLKACSHRSEIAQVHGHMFKTGLDLLPFPISKLLASSIFDMDYARSIFNKIGNPSLFNFNTMLRGYSISATPSVAFSMFNCLRARAILLDQFSFITTLKSCARSSAIRTGTCIHGLVVTSGFELFQKLRNSLMSFYCACRETWNAHKVFDEMPQMRDVVSWNVLMGGYLQMTQLQNVLELFKLMQIDGVEIGTVTVIDVLLASGGLRHIRMAETAHGYCVKNGFSLSLDVITATISAYTKVGILVHARKLFDETMDKDVVLWNCIIDGYARYGLLKECLSLLELMSIHGFKPNSVTLAGVLSVCASSGALAVGRWIHEYAEKEGLLLDSILGTSLIHMYSKCGRIPCAVEIFNQMQAKDVMAWTSMIDGFGIHGQGVNALQLFHQMEKEGVIPNEVTFLALLNACDHGGLVLEGAKCFEWMIGRYRLFPRIEHYGSIIDLLGRAGLLEEAYKLIKSLPVKEDAAAWRALLSACRIYGNIKLAEISRDKLAELGYCPSDSILLQNSYAIVGRWDSFLQEHVMMDKPTMQTKEAGWSSIEVQG